MAILIRGLSYGSLLIVLYAVTIVYLLYEGTRSRERFKKYNPAIRSIRQRKIILAFNWWEQLTMASNNLLGLTALAAYGERQVVVPFVENSRFSGTPTKNNKTLAFYYNVKALNNKLRSHGHATLINWEGFQDVCKARLDLLVYIDYPDLKVTTNYSRSAPFYRCNDRHKTIFKCFNIGKTICMDASLDSVQRFENEVVMGLPCVGIFQWRGIGHKHSSARARFDTSHAVRNILCYRNISSLFSSKLHHIAENFVAKHLGGFFVSVHIRTEWLLGKGLNISDLVKCISFLSARVQSIRDKIGRATPVFLAADFAEFGSSSYEVIPVRKRSESLKKIVAPLKPITFNPSEFKLADRGAIAIVEMEILASGNRLVVLGGGTFQSSIVDQFLKKQKATAWKVDRLSYQSLTGSRHVC